MLPRLCKIALVFALAVFTTLVVLGNVTDYGANFAYVSHVLKMDTTFPPSRDSWRAIHSPAAHHAFYGGIILWEALVAGLCFAGALRLWRARRATAAVFHHAKSLAIVGITAGLLLWFGAFITIGGEWFLMWQSTTWNGIDAAARLFTCFGIVLLFVSLRDDELASG